MVETCSRHSDDEDEPRSRFVMYHDAITLIRDGRSYRFRPDGQMYEVDADGKQVKLEADAHGDIKETASEGPSSGS